MSLHFHSCECGMPARCAADVTVRRSGGVEFWTCVPGVRCYECESGRESPYTYGYLAQDCCLLGARAVRKDELKTYRLVGDPTDWFICPTCHRTFGREPKEMDLYADQRSAP